MVIRTLSSDYLGELAPKMLDNAIGEKGQSGEDKECYRKICHEDTLFSLSGVKSAMRKWLRKEEINRVREIKCYCTFSSFHNLDRQPFDRSFFNCYFSNGSRYQASEPTEKWTSERGR